MADFINTIDVLGDDAVVDSIITRTITEYCDDGVTKIGERAFYNCTALIKVDVPNAENIDKEGFCSCKALPSVCLPNVKSIGQSSFRECAALTEVDAPNLESIGSSAFQNCKKLTDINMSKVTAISGNAFFSTGLTMVHAPLATTVDSSAFAGCTNLTLVDLSVRTSIGANAFQNCNSLVTVILRSSTMCTLVNVNAFTGNWSGGYGPIYNGTGYIYVPRALVDSYKVATNWSTYATQFRALEDYTVDGTVTGDLDESKI